MIPGNQWNPRWSAVRSDRVQVEELQERRSALDTRSDEEKRSIGEWRSGNDRRSGEDRRAAPGDVSKKS